MNKANIPSTYRFILAKSNKTIKEYHFEQIEHGKLLVPLKLRIKKPHKNSKEITVQFFDSPNWRNCSRHKLSKKPFTNSYSGKREFKKWSIPIAIRMDDNGGSLELRILDRTAKSKVYNHV